MKKTIMCILFVLMVTPLVLPTAGSPSPNNNVRKVATVVLGR